MLRISTDKVCFAIIKAREFDVKVAPERLDSGSNPSDDGQLQILEDYADDPTLEELKTFLGELNDEELADLLALTWLGRGGYTVEEWGDILAEIRDVRAYHTVDYLIGQPLLGDLLEEGLSQFGQSCTEFESGHL